MLRERAVAGTRPERAIEYADPSAPVPHKIRLAFAAFDRNRSGFLDYRELRNALRHMGFVDTTLGEAAAVVHDAADSAAANAVSDVVDRVLAANPHIPRAGLAYFNTSEEITSAMVSNPEAYLAAVHFPADFGFSAPSMTVQFNESAYCAYVPDTLPAVYTR